MLCRNHFNFNEKAKFNFKFNSTLRNTFYKILKIVVYFSGEHCSSLNNFKKNNVLFTYTLFMTL